MAKKKRSPKTLTSETRETRTSFTFASLHGDVARAVSDHIASIWFNKDDDSGEICIKDYSTNVMGSFKCKNAKCSTNRWTSKMVSIVIRGYPNNGYSATVFNQRCKSCNGLGTFTLDRQSYVERVAYRLEKWAGCQVKAPYYGEGKGLPHREDLCEGCKQGICWSGF
ncbi:hypothetical protein M406DRAFT_260477 [Cryphonectria parasitica EP155]|uniref:3CxxC-type domain-containing protein n=1 Tax=Cryphonectria parasitica (strain ATCC 38755 / EP155) TaxID=660469 RepID=A0A9P4Y0J1_CRYP1|nr:uncharacterized protein M406DRAFT_260477 [Cryphonectria parasitica EP155]KAF3764443.1 hypothetical protein M406DRAFT_260477 [Cryphonectria parasitica EP155]